MILQNVVFKDSVDAGQELYYRVNGEAVMSPKGLCLGRHSEVSTDTYFNLFDVVLWKKYTRLNRLKLEIDIMGKGVIEIYTGLQGKRQRIMKEYFEFEDFNTACLNIPVEKISDKIFFSVKAEEECWIKQGKYCDSEINGVETDTKLGLIICTYQRNRELIRNVEKLHATAFFDKSSELYSKLVVYIIDNASELPDFGYSGIKLFHNPNTGGSGGFARGVRECVKERDKTGISHIIFMDDDVLFSEETFYRLYAFLNMFRKDIPQEVISGRMFCMDQKNVQYTSTEIWNKGFIKHVHGNEDMRKLDNLQNVNESNGDYSGWWFACFPVSFVEKNHPLPFFLHCDDVEYGLRFGRSPLVLNGIQAWHETPDFRKSMMISYYDMRNALIVNSMYYKEMNWWDVLIRWLKTVGYDQFREKSEYEYAAIVALLDYMKGKETFLRSGTKKEFAFPERLMKKTVMFFLAGLTGALFLLKGKKAFESYRNLDIDAYSLEAFSNSKQFGEKL